MEIRLTKPIENFIERQLARGYADADEVARQAFLRWMEEEEQLDVDPPHLQEKLQAALDGQFRTFRPEVYAEILTSLNEPSR